MKRCWPPPRRISPSRILTKIPGPRPYYTTGTTGLPKGVCFSHRQLVLHTLVLRAVISAGAGQGHLNPGDVYMPLTPMFHVHAWGMPYLATTLATKQVYPGRYVPDRLARLIQREKVNYSHCVPTIHPANDSGCR